MKILGQPGLEISIPSTLKRETTSYVVITRRTERFVDEIQDYKNVPAQIQHRITLSISVIRRERTLCGRKQSNSFKETGAHPITSRHGNKEACANNLSNSPSDSLFKKTIILTNERKWIVIDANPSHGGELSIQITKMVTKMVRHHDQYEREQDGSYHWDTVRSVLLMAFARYGAQIFSEDHWIRLIHEGRSKKRFEYCVDHKNPLCYLRAIQGHSGGIPIVPELMGHTSMRFHRGCSWDVQSFLESGLIPGGKENDKTRQAIFFTPLNLFGENLDEENPHDDYTIPQKVHFHTYWNVIRMPSIV